MTRLLGGLVTLTLALAAVVLGAPAAQAHNVLQSTDPAAGSTVPYIPETVSLTFNEPVLFVGTTIMVHTADDVMVNIGPPILVDNTVSQAVTGELPAGEYTVIYRVTSAEEPGHASPRRRRPSSTTTRAVAPRARPMPPRTRARVSGSEVVAVGAVTAAASSTTASSD